MRFSELEQKIEAVTKLGEDVIQAATGGDLSGAGIGETPGLEGFGDETE